MRAAPWVAILLLIPLAAGSAGMQVSVTPGAVTAAVQSDGNTTVQVVVVRDDPIVGAVVDRVARVNVTAGVTNVTLDGLRIEADAQVMLFPGNEVLPTIGGGIQILDGEATKSKKAIQDVLVRLQQPASGPRIVEHGVVTEGWMQMAQPLVTAGGFVVVGYVKQRPLTAEEQIGLSDEEGKHATTAGPLFARVSRDGGATFGPEVALPTSGTPRGHWAAAEVAPDTLMFFMDSEDAWMEARVWDVRNAEPGPAIFLNPPGANRMSLTPSVAPHPDGGLLLATGSLDIDGAHAVSLWHVQANGSMEMVASFPGRGDSVQLAAGRAGIHLVWRASESVAAPKYWDYHVRHAWAPTILGPFQSGPLHELNNLTGEGGTWGPTKASMDGVGRIHFTYGVAGEEQESWYVAAGPDGTTVRALGGEDPAIHHQALATGARIWLVEARGWSGQTFFSESMDGGITFTTYEVASGRGQLFYGAGNGMVDRPLAVLPDGTPLVLTNWYVPTPREEALVLVRPFDPWSGTKADIPANYPKGQEEAPPPKDSGVPGDRSQDDDAGDADEGGEDPPPARDSPANDSQEDDEVATNVTAGVDRHEQDHTGQANQTATADGRQGRLDSADDREPTFVDMVTPNPLALVVAALGLAGLRRRQA